MARKASLLFFVSSSWLPLVTSFGEADGEMKPLFWDQKDPLPLERSRDTAKCPNASLAFQLTEDRKLQKNYMIAWKISNMKNIEKTVVAAF